MSVISGPFSASYHLAYSMIDRISYHLDKQIHLTSSVFNFTFHLKKGEAKKLVKFSVNSEKLFQLPKTDAKLLTLLQSQARWYLKASNSVSPKIRKYLTDLINCSSHDDNFAKTALSKVRSTFDHTGFMEVKFALLWLFKEFKRLAKSGEQFKIHKFSMELKGFAVSKPEKTFTIRAIPLKGKWSLCNK